MAKASTEEKDDADLDDADASEEDHDEAGSSDEDKAEDRSSEESEPAGDDGEAEEKSPAPLARMEATSKEITSEKGAPSEGDSEEDAEEEESEEEAAAQLGIQRYVLASFFAAGIVGAYVLGRAVHGLWGWAANKDWFHNALPTLAAIDDDRKATFGTIIGAVIAIVAVIRSYRRPSVRAWADEVASELAKVKWPTRKEVSSSTIVVIAAGAVATLYLALLDRLWSFVTDLFYGTGS